MNKKLIESILESFHNGQKKQMTEQINEYGLYDFFEDLKKYIFNQNMNIYHIFDTYSNIVIAYHKIQYR